MARKRKTLEPWQKADAVRLKEIFRGKVRITQESFGDLYELGSQGLVTQYLNGIIPLNYESAYKFARGMGCSIHDFSPRLASELMKFSECAMPKRKHKEPA